MKWKVVSGIACILLMVIGIGSALLNEAEGLPHRYMQHIESQQVDDLSEEDQAAVKSSDIDAQTFASHLPVVSINTRGQEIPGEPARGEDGKLLADENGSYIPTLASDGSESILADIKIYDAQNEANRLSDVPVNESSCQIRVRGNSSRFYDKKNYHIVLTKEDGITDNDQALMGMESCETWALQGTSIDKTMIRNYLTYNTAAQFISGFVPDLRYCEVFINGEYSGLYMLTETIKMEEGRVQLNPSDEKLDKTSYIAAIDESAPLPTTVSNFLYYTLRTKDYLDIIYPSELALTEGQKKYIVDDLSYVEKCLYSYDYDTYEYGYWNTIDIDSFVDMYVLNEFVINDDFGAYSTYLYKDVRGKVTLGPPWDYDNTFDLYADPTPVDKFYLVESAWYFMLFKDEKFCERVINRYKELRLGPLSEENLNLMIDEALAYIEPALERNWRVWGYTFEADRYVEPEERRPENGAEAVNDLKTFIHDRGEWLDKYIENLRQYSHESAVKKFNH